MSLTFLKIGKILGKITHKSHLEESALLNKFCCVSFLIQRTFTYKMADSGYTKPRVLVGLKYLFHNPNNIKPEDD